MSDPTDTGWRPLSKPQDRRAPGPGSATAVPVAGGGRLNPDGTRKVTAFVRLARTHALHAAGDATYAVALVGSIFALDTDAARGRILLYLLLTLAPFALVGPFIGPFLDRMKGGRRLMIIGTLIVRAVLMLLLIRNIESLWLFPIAFTQLVMAKSYSVAKVATVPTTVSSEEELVDKNARLAVLGVVAGAAGGAPALALQALFGSSVTVGYGFIVYVLGVAAALRLPRVQVDDPDVADEVVDLRSSGVRLAASAMSVMRGISGFVFFLLVFAFGSNDLDLNGTGKAVGASIRQALGFSIDGDNSEPAWKLGFALAAFGLGGFIGNVLAPRLRERFSEEHMLIGALGATLVASAFGIWAGGLGGAMALALIVGASSASGKLAFDSLVQRDAPGANLGAAFGRFETRFQVASVLGSVVAVAPTVTIPIRAGAFVVAIAAGVAGTLYLLGSRGVQVPGTQGEIGEWFGGQVERLRSRGEATDAAEREADAEGESNIDVADVVMPVAPSGVDDPMLVGAPAADGSSVHGVPVIDPTQPPPAKPPSPNPAATSAPVEEPRAEPTQAELHDRWAAPPTLAVDRVEGPDASAPTETPAPNVDFYEAAFADQSLDAPDWVAPIDDGPTGPDLYDQGFAEQRVEPVDWAAPVFDPPPAADPMLPPQWLDGDSQDPSDEPLPVEDTPTPPYGQPRVED